MNSSRSSFSFFTLIISSGLLENNILNQIDALKKKLKTFKVILAMIYQVTHGLSCAS